MLRASNIFIFSLASKVLVLVHWQIMASSLNGLRVEDSLFKISGLHIRRITVITCKSTF
ncbi:hypothetical protein Syun_016732 [Stephania yunnanensis]|uniref:Uncharacterized protein n=1 Tax=Stephania yunnanensis TaxID=152371 RepID=A0AAP0J780_9MAGN